MLYIYINECGGEYQSWYSAHRTNDPDKAIALAIRKHWGRAAGWLGDYKLNRSLDSSRVRYGHIIGPCITGGYNCTTPRVRIDIE